jgi:hypothetical protein
MGLLNLFYCVSGTQYLITYCLVLYMEPIRPSVLFLCSQTMATYCISLYIGFHCVFWISVKFSDNGKLTFNSGILVPVSTGPCVTCKFFEPIFSLLFLLGGRVGGGEVVVVWWYYHDGCKTVFHFSFCTNETFTKLCSDVTPLLVTPTPRFSFLQSVITTWRTVEFVRRYWHRRHVDVLEGPEVMFGNRRWQVMRFLSRWWFCGRWDSMATVLKLVLVRCCIDYWCVIGAIHLIFDTEIATCNIVYVFWNYRLDGGTKFWRHTLYLTNTNVYGISS